MLGSPQMPQKDDIQSVLITSAAARILRPFGLTQKGRSHTWIADQGWWLIVVEFQPSGTYLNVGCMWLWRVKPYFSFDVFQGFHKFSSGLQFGDVAEQLATSAREKVIDYRRHFPTIRQVSDYYAENAPTMFWSYFNAAVAHLLSGRLELGSNFMSKCLPSKRDDLRWLIEARQDANMLASMMDQPEKFRGAIDGRVRETRRLLNLSQLPQVDFGYDPVVVR